MQRCLPKETNLQLRSKAKSTKSLESCRVKFFIFNARSFFKISHAHKKKKLYLKKKDNIAKVIKRGDDLEDLQNKSEGLQNSSLQFRRGATKVRQQMWWKDMKLKVILLIVVLAVLAIITVWISHKAIVPKSGGSTPSWIKLAKNKKNNTSCFYETSPVPFFFFQSMKRFSTPYIYQREKKKKKETWRGEGRRRKLSHLSG